MKRRTVSIALLAPLIFGCETVRLPSIKAGEPVAIVVTTGPQAGSTAIRNTAIGDDAATGAGAGAVTGVLIGLGCGNPLFIALCVPFGALAMGGGGYVAGAAVGMAESLPQEKVDQLSRRLRRIRQANSLLDELRTNVNLRAQKNWRLTSDTSQTAVTIELREVFLNSTRAEKIVLVLRVMVSVHAGGGKPGGEPRQKQFQYVGPVSEFAVWMDEHNEFAESSFRIACQQIAAQIIAELAVNR